MSDVKIMIVEDENITALELRERLEEWGYTVPAVVSTGTQAIQKAAETMPDLVLMDIILKGDMDGVEAAEQIRARLDIPVIYVTAYADERTLQRAKITEPYGYILKPFEERELRIIIEMALYKHLMEKVLKESNRKILAQQKAVIEEERLKVLLQLAGAAAYELNQPLADLLESIDLMEKNRDNSEKLDYLMARVEKAGQRISDIVKGIQTIPHDEPKPSVSASSMIHLDQPVKILIVEDEELGFTTIKAMLVKYKQINLSWAKSIEEAVQLLEKEQFNMILLDYLLSNETGLDFLRIMDEKGMKTPVVIITAYGDEMVAAQVIQAGAYDYLPKDKLCETALSRIIANTLEKARLKREIHAAMQRMAEMSTKDELTGLYNRRYFMEALKQEVSRARRYETGLVLCMMDLDHFKRINDTYGHAAGDMVLSEIGKMLKECFRESDLVCRYGGEEFSVILPNTESEEVRAACERFREMVAGHTFQYGLSQFQMTVSIGFAGLRSSKAQSADELVVLADQTLYQVKEAGRSGVAMYSASP